MAVIITPRNLCQVPPALKCLVNVLTGKVDRPQNRLSSNPTSQELKVRMVQFHEL